MAQPLNKIIVNIIGYPASGKSHICEHIAKRGFDILRPSDVLRAYAKQHNVTLTGRADYIALHQRLNADNPYAIIEPIIDSSSLYICVDGLRSPMLLDKLQQKLPHVITIALDCPIEERFRRVQADDVRRGTHRAPKTLDAFRADEAPDIKNPDRNLPNMQEMFERADYTIDASQTPESIVAALDAILDIEIARSAGTSQ